MATTMGLILVASADAVEVETIKAALSVHGWWVTVAEDRQTAVQTAADQAPKLVIVDQDLPDSIELVRAFGATNGGPGVVACVPDGFESTLELKEAGVDELITKPLSPPGLLEVVQRCLSAPPPSEVPRPTSSKQLLTTEEIFGDVLRELEGEPPAPPAIERPAPSIAAASPPPTPAPKPGPAPAAAPTADDPFGAAPASQPVVSLAGLFDDDEPPQAESAATPPAPEPVKPAPSAAVDEPSWNGVDRRGPDRPWDVVREESKLTSIDDLFADGDAEAVVQAAAPAPSPPLAAELEADTADFVAAATQDDAVAVIEDEAPTVASSPRRKLPRAAVVIGALAAALLIAAGVVFFVNPGGGAGEVATEPEVVTMPPVGDAPEPSPLASEPVTPEPSSESAAAPPAAAEPAPIDEIDLESIVAEEMQRREEELRRVFLEEERRLLRELDELDESDEPPAEPSGDGDGDR